MILPDSVHSEPDWKKKSFWTERRWWRRLAEYFQGEIDPWILLHCYKTFHQSVMFSVFQELFCGEVIFFFFSVYPLRRSLPHLHLLELVISCGSLNCAVRAEEWNVRLRKYDLCPWNLLLCIFYFTEVFLHTKLLDRNQNHSFWTTKPTLHDVT